MNEELHVDEKLIESFHLMYDHFPEVVQLTHKSKRIVAVNPACQAIGREVGMICAAHGPSEAHQGCLAAGAIRDQAAKWKPIPGKDNAVVFWLPIDGYPDFYIHFAMGYAVNFSNPPEDKQVSRDRCDRGDN